LFYVLDSQGSTLAVRGELPSVIPKECPRDFSPLGPDQTCLGLAPLAHSATTDLNPDPIQFSFSFHRFWPIFPGEELQGMCHLSPTFLRSLTLFSPLQVGYLPSGRNSPCLFHFPHIRFPPPKQCRGSSRTFILTTIRLIAICREDDYLCNEIPLNHLAVFGSFAFLSNDRRYTKPRPFYVPSSCW